MFEWLVVTGFQEPQVSTRVTDGESAQTVGGGTPEAAGGGSLPAQEPSVHLNGGRGGSGHGWVNKEEGYTSVYWM